MARYNKVSFPAVVWFTLNERIGDGLWKRVSMVLEKNDVTPFVPAVADCYTEPYFRYAQKAAVAKAKAQQIEWIAMTGPDWFMNY